MIPLLLLSCVGEGDPDLDALRSDLEALQADLDAANRRIEALEAADVPSEGYTDAMAVAAVQNATPFDTPDRANLLNLWHRSAQGYHWLDSARWTWDNRSDPPGARPRHELAQLFHETPECTASSTFADCDATAAMKIYANGPQITDNDWSPAGFAAAALRHRHTHASALYLVSFGQGAQVTDVPYGLIPPSGIHLEPHGAHQALRIDGTGNSGENVRIDTTLGAKGIAIYQSPDAGLYCEALGAACDDSYPLYLRGGLLHLEDLRVERSATDARNGGVVVVHDTSLGVEHFTSWHDDPETGLPVHCVWNDTVTDRSLVRVQAYASSPDLRVAHSYALREVWGPGGAPSACASTQLIRTNASGVYGYAFPDGVVTGAGFSVALLGPDPTPLYPGDWREEDRPALLYEVIEPL